MVLKHELLPNKTVLCSLQDIFLCVSRLRRRLDPRMLQDCLLRERGQLIEEGASAHA